MGAQAQEVKIINGRILNDSLDNSSLHIVNLNLQKGTITNKNGEFSIPARINDTLNISGIQFQHKKIVVNAIAFNKGQISFYMEPQVSELDAVQISDITLSGRLGADMKIPNLKDPFNPGAVGLPVYDGPHLTVEERRLYTASSGIGLGALINYLSGRTKMLKKHVEVSRMENRVQKARKIFSDSMYVKNLHIPENLVDDFAHFVYMDKLSALAIAERRNELELLEFLMKRSKDYFKHKELID
tara:strand:- start:1170 stop:1898 length:729 start_codon:yes stop_codon:yes gene_type:complete